MDHFYCTQCNHVESMCGCFTEPMSASFEPTESSQLQSQTMQYTDMDESSQQEEVLSEGYFSSSSEPTNMMGMELGLEQQTNEVTESEGQVGMNPSSGESPSEKILQGPMEADSYLDPTQFL